VFLATEYVHSDVWLKYYRRIAEYMQMPCDTAEDHEALWDAVAGLESFHNKLSMPKLGRWFAWNGCAHMQMKEFHATKMLFEHHLEDSADSDEVETFDTESFEAAAKAETPQGELAALKASSGGLRLAYKLMSSSLQRHIKILYVATQQCWTWYADQVDKVKTPSQGLNYCV